MTPATRALGVLAVVVAVVLTALGLYRLHPHALVHAVATSIVGTLAGAALGVLMTAPSEGGGS